MDLATVQTRTPTAATMANFRSSLDCTATANATAVTAKPATAAPTIGYADRIRNDFIASRLRALLTQCHLTRKAPDTAWPGSLGPRRLSSELAPIRVPPAVEGPNTCRALVRFPPQDRLDPLV